MNLDLYLDATRKQLVYGPTSPTRIALPFFGKSDSVNLRIQLLNVNASGGYATPYTIINTATKPDGLKVSVGSLGGASPLASADLTTFDSTYNFFTGTLDLNTSALNTAVGSSSTYATYLEIKALDGSDYVTLASDALTIRNYVYNPAGATVPDPSDSYYTSAQIISGFVAKMGAAGDTIRLLSPDGTKAVILGCRDDGTFQVDYESIS